MARPQPRVHQEIDMSRRKIAALALVGGVLLQAGGCTTLLVQLAVQNVVSSVLSSLISSATTAAGG